jgi:glycosyltransferase involved in cell wall biosynthesis
MRRLRAALVAPSLTILGGQSVQAERLLREWNGDADVEAWLVPVNPPFPRPLRFAASVKYLRTIVNELVYIPTLFRRLARADVVHVFSASYTSFLLAPLPAILAGRLLGKPVLLNYRSGEAPDHLQRSRVARWALRLADGNVVPSTFLVDVFSGFGIPASVIPNLVDFDRFRYRERRPVRPRLLSTRNFDGLYNVACTLRAFRLVQDRWPGASLTLVGGGREEGNLRRLVRALNLANVTFPGRVPPDDIVRFYDEHDIYVQTPDIDNMPTSVIEAFASGLPVVSTNAGGVPAIVTHGQNGLLAPLDDHEAIARHVLSLLDDPDGARRLATSAIASCQDCRWTSVRGQWLRAYQALLDTAKNPGRLVADPISHR